MAGHEVLKDFTVHTGHGKEAKTLKFKAGQFVDAKVLGIPDKTLHALSLGEKPFIHIDRSENRRPELGKREEK